MRSPSTIGWCLFVGVQALAGCNDGLPFAPDALPTPSALTFDFSSSDNGGILTGSDTPVALAFDRRNPDRAITVPPNSDEWLRLPGLFRLYTLSECFSGSTAFPTEEQLPAGDVIAVSNVTVEVRVPANSPPLRGVCYAIRTRAGGFRMGSGVVAVSDGAVEHSYLATLPIGGEAIDALSIAPSSVGWSVLRSVTATATGP